MLYGADFSIAGFDDGAQCAAVGASITANTSKHGNLCSENDFFNE
jgi:hypothetical protein